MRRPFELRPAGRPASAAKDVPSGSRWAQLICACLIFLTAAAHAVFVLLWNSPDGNAVKSVSQSLLLHSAAPWVDQDWSLFAPEAPTYNTDIFVQGRTARRVSTQWYDVSRYFNSGWRADPFSREHYLSEDLAHSADFLFSQNAGERRACNAVVRRITALVLRKYAQERRLKEMRIEIDRYYIAAAPPEKPRKHMIEDKVLPWTPLPVAIDD